jgi:hypothetical protein
LAPFWITPCCGTWNSYRFENWTCNGYACGACKEPERVVARMRLDVCVGCGMRATFGQRFQTQRLYDDVYTLTLTTYCLCPRCNVLLLSQQPLALSLVREGPRILNAIVKAIK